MKAITMSIQHKNLPLLATEIFKTQKNLNRIFMHKIFEEKVYPYTLHSGRNVLAPQSSTIGYGIENTRFVFLERRLVL